MKIQYDLCHATSHALLYHFDTHHHRKLWMHFEDFLSEHQINQGVPVS